MTQSAILALAEGSLFYGRAIGKTGQTTGEVVFNTAMTGYQEILTDPSYCRQIVTLTQPHIGVVGVNPADAESDRVYCSGLVIRDLPSTYSSWRAAESLSTYLQQQNVVAIADIDTRRLTRILRDQGAQNGCILAGATPDPEVALAGARAFPGLQGMDLAKVVSATQGYPWTEGNWSLSEKRHAAPSAVGRRRRVVAYDFGIKRQILRILADLGCEVNVVPATTPGAEVMSRRPDGVFLSNGPGDPGPCDYAIDAIHEIIESGTPVFGICLGHQLLGLAAGAKTSKMKFGHHGANHPVLDLDTRRVIITSQNHGFAVDEDSLPDTLRPTHRSLFDGSLQGIHHRELPAFGFQGHPEASPGPHDLRPLFEHFMELMRQKADN